MTLIQRKILANVESGDWSFFDLQHLFLSELKNRKPVRAGFHIPLAVYENVNLRIQRRPSFFSSEMFESGLDFNKVSLLVKETGVADKFSSEEEGVLRQSLDFFSKKYEAQYEIFETVFAGLLRVKGGNFSGSSNPRAWGIYFLGDKFFNLSEEQRAVSFIHEMAHQELFLINLLDRLAKREADKSLVFAPLQGKLRPPIKRLHSLWALFRMIQFSSEFGINIVQQKSKFEENISSFLENELTEFGENLVESVKKCFALQLV